VSATIDDSEERAAAIRRVRRTVVRGGEPVDIVAEALGCSTWTVQNWIEQGAPVIRVGKQKLVDTEALPAWLDDWSKKHPIGRRPRVAKPEEPAPRGPGRPKGSKNRTK
jgi:hypothetical protein